MFNATEFMTNDKYKLHHSAWAKGYISRDRKNPKPQITKYNGRFGKGYIVHYPTWESTTYHRIDYFVER